MVRPISRHLDPKFVIDKFRPSYLALAKSGEIDERVAKGLLELDDCCACPRDCHVARNAGKTGLCMTGRYARVSSVFPHMGEEDCLRGWRGSGTIFFSMCNLRCVFCQNWDISQNEKGQECGPEELAAAMLELQDLGCHNINFVTPEHVVPQVIEAIAAAIPRGLSLPIVYNTSAYDCMESLKLLDGLIDIYMPDFKCWTKESATRFLKARDYPERAREAIAEMHRQVGALKFSSEGLALQGVLIRHLVMPGGLDETAAIFKWLAEEVSPDTFVNIMGQYRPEHRVGKADRHGRMRYTELDRRPAPNELAGAVQAARDAGLHRFDERWL